MPPSHKTSRSVIQTWACSDCGHRLVLVADDAGQEHVLDTSVVTWVISGRLDDADRAIVVRSGGYPEHACRLVTTPRYECRSF